MSVRERVYTGTRSFPQGAFTEITSETLIQKGEILRCTYHLDSNNFFDNQFRLSFIESLLEEQEIGNINLLLIENPGKKLVIIFENLKEGPKNPGLAAYIIIGFILSIATGITLYLSLEKIEKLTTVAIPNPFGDRFNLSFAPVLALVALLIGGGFLIKSFRK